jgi:hypothetical protein
MPHHQEGSIESSHFSADILEFIQLLQVHQAKYIVVGGEAVIYMRIVCPDREIALFMIDLRNLLRNKRAASRPKDLDDLRALGE